METKEEHLKYIFAKSEETRRKFNLYNIGSGLFTDSVFSEKELKEKKDD